MTSLDFCSLLKLPADIKSDIDADSITFSSEFLLEAAGIYRRMLDTKLTTLIIKAELFHYIARLMRIGADLVSVSRYRLRSKYKPKSSLILFILALRLFDTRAGVAILDKKKRLRQEIWGMLCSIERDLAECPIAYGEMKFITETFEPRGTRFAVELNRLDNHWME